MNGRSDASTSTDDVKGRPLCLFYFSQPLGVLAAEPPSAAPCPAHFYRPPEPCPAHPYRPSEPSAQPLYRPSEAYTTHLYRPSEPCATPLYRPSEINASHSYPGAARDMAPAWDLLWAPAPRSSAEYLSRCSSRPPRDTRSSSLFSGDWPPSSASSRGEFPRRGVPYHALLPPLRLPPPAPLAPLAAEPSAWPLLGAPPERFSLPPIELPRLSELDSGEESGGAAERAPVAWAAPESLASSRLSRRGSPAPRARRRAGVHKPRRRTRASALRRTLTNLMQRTIKGGLFAGSHRGGSTTPTSCCVRAALRTLRAAWPPPAPPPRAHRSPDASWRAASQLSSAGAMPRAPERPGASPGLLRRRYSVPETIMRKYRLEQQSNESDDTCAASSPSSATPPACGGCGGCGARRGDRELMRKSALLRRLWGRAPPAPRTSRSLHGSSSELRRSPAASGWTTPKRQRLEWAEQRAPSSPPSPAEPRSERFDCTFGSHRAPSPATRAPLGRPERDVFARYSDLAGDAARAELAAAPRAPPADPSGSATDTSDTFSDSVPTAQEARPMSVPEPLITGGEINQYTSLPFEVLSGAGSPSYEVLEIMVSETVDGPRAPSPRRGAGSAARNINIDEYVSNILVESLNSLSEQLDSMSAAVGGAGLVVEKEIKVRLQHTGVNTVVHLSPTSNHQIIFGNEELVHADNEPRDACNNPLDSPREPNNNEPEGVNRAVLQQIQKLFHDELYRLDPCAEYPGEPTLGRIEVSDVDHYLDQSGDSGPPSTGAVGVGVGNYWARAEPALVPRLSALPHSASMEVNASSSSAEPSGCTSLVDSLDDPASPRVPPAPPAPRRLVRSAVDVLDLLPERPKSPPRERAEAFFVRFEDDGGDEEREDVVVADRMPDRIRERLLRRHRKREMRLECARRGRSRGAARERRRDAERDASQVVAALIDELIAKIAQDEYKCMRIQQRQRADPAPPAPVGRRAKNRAPQVGDPFDAHVARAELRGRLSLQPAGEPRRFYQKSEIHDGNKCIEILEILEYVDDSQNSPETTNSDERHSNSKSRKSRIPIPIYERIQRTSTIKNKRSEDSRPFAPSPPPPPARRASVPLPAESRSRAGSLRFRRVFDMIPEERAGPGADSPLSHDEAATARRVSAPSLSPTPPALPAPPAPPARATRSAATSPPAPQRASRSTMTSPRRAVPAPPPPRVAAGSNGHLNEKRVKSENSKQRRASQTARAAGGGPPALPPAGPAEGSRALRARPASRRSSSSGSDSASSSLLCAAPRWLAARRRRPRASRAARAASRALPAAQADGPEPAVAGPEGGAGGAGGAGGWSVTVAGSCRAALPADVEMRLRFPRDARAPRARAAPRPDADTTPRRSVATRSDETGTTECWCRCCSCPAPPVHPAHAAHAPPVALPAPPRSRRASLSLPLRKEESVGGARKSRKKHTQLPELEPARAERRRLSGKMRRACSLQCWLPATAPRRAGELAVEGSAIVPERKPRAPSMSERDLTRRLPAHPAHLCLRC